jgi:hypothetical protein
MELLLSEILCEFMVQDTTSHVVFPEYEYVASQIETVQTWRLLKRTDIERGHRAFYVLNREAGAFVTCRQLA